MNKEQKATAVEEVAKELSEATAIFAIDYKGISVPQSSELRVKLTEADADFRVVKNRLAKLSAAKAGTDGLEDYLTGPTALTFVRGDVVLAAKAISAFTKEHDVLTFRGGLMDGKPLDPDQFTSLAKLPGVDQLRAQLVGIAASPITTLVRGLGSMISGLAVALGQIAEQGLVSGEAPAEAPAEPEAAEEETAAPEAAEEAPESESEPAEPEPEAQEEAPEADASDESGEESPADKPEDESAEESAEEAEAAPDGDMAEEESAPDEASEEPSNTEE